MRSLLLHGGRVIDPANNLDRQTDLLLRDGKVASVGNAAAREADPDTLNSTPAASSSVPA